MCVCVFSVVNAVLQKTHTLKDTEVTVTPYYPFLSVEANTPSAGPEDQMSVDEEQPVTSASPNVVMTSRESATPMFSTPESTVDDSMEYGPRASSDPDTSVCLNVSVPDDGRLELLSWSDLLTHLRSSNPDFQMVLTQTGVEIKGPGRGRAETLRNDLLELVGGASQARVPLSELKVPFLRRESVRTRLGALLRGRGLSCVIAESDGDLVLTADSAQNLDRARDVITGQLTEWDLALEMGHECMILTQQWRDFLSALECHAQVADDARSVVLVTLKDDEEDIRSRILHFLNTPIQTERVLSMEPAMLEYLQLHHQQLLQELPQVVIVPLDTGDGLSVSSKCAVGLSDVHTDTSHPHRQWDAFISAQAQQHEKLRHTFTIRDRLKTRCDSDVSVTGATSAGRRKHLHVPGK